MLPIMHTLPFFLFLYVVAGECWSLHWTCHTKISFALVLHHQYKLYFLVTIPNTVEFFP